MKFELVTVERYKIEYKGKTLWYASIDEISKRALSDLLDLYCNDYGLVRDRAIIKDSILRGVSDLKDILNIKMPEDLSSIAKTEERKIDL